MRTLALILTLTVLPGAWAEESAVEIAVWSGVEFIPQEQYELRVSHRYEEDVTDQFEDGEARLAYGPYRLQIKLPGFATYKRDFEVERPETDILALLKLGDIANYADGAPPTRLVGQIRNSPLPLDRMWVRILNAEEGSGEPVLKDSRVGEDGSFAFDLPNWTRQYWVLVLALDGEAKDPGERPAKVVRAVLDRAGPRGDKNLEIDLSGP